MNNQAIKTVAVYGTTIKELIHEEFGEGIGWRASAEPPSHRAVDHLAHGMMFERPARKLAAVTLLVAENVGSPG
jgi:hypothetical protein